MAVIKRLNFKKIKIVFVGKYRYSKNNDDFDNITVWKDWKLGFWFRKIEVVGIKNSKDPNKWCDNTVNQYIIGCNLLIFQGWITICKDGLNFEIKEKKDKFYYEKIATVLIEEEKVKRNMKKEDVIVEIYNQVKIDLGNKKTNSMIRHDKNFLNNVIFSIDEKLKEYETNR